MVGLSSIPLAAMPPRAAGAGAAPDAARKAAAAAADRDLTLRRSLRAEETARFDQAHAHLDSAAGKDLPEIAGSSAWFREAMISENVSNRVHHLYVKEAIQACLDAQKRPGRRMREKLHAEAYAVLEGLETRMEHEVLGRAQACEARRRELRDMETRLRARLEKAGHAPGDRAGISLEIASLESASAGLEVIRNGLRDALGRQPWRTWRKVPGITPRGAAPAPPPLAIPESLSLPVLAGGLKMDLLPPASRALEILHLRDGLGHPYVGELPGATVPMLPPAPSPARSRAERRQIEAKVRAGLDPLGVPRPAARAAEAVDHRLERLKAQEELMRKQDLERSLLQAERAERDHRDAVLEREAEAKAAALREQRHAERLLMRRAARERRERERREREARPATDRERAEAAALRQQELDERERREAEVEAAAERLERHYQALLERKAPAAAADEAPEPAPPARGAAAGPARPPITTIEWSPRAEKQRDELDALTDEGVEDALEMLRSDGIDLRGKRTKLIRNTHGKVVEIRVRCGRSVWRLLYVHLAPDAIEIVRLTPTSQEAGAAFDEAVEQARAIAASGN